VKSPNTRKTGEYSAFRKSQDGGRRYRGGCNTRVVMQFRVPTAVKGKPLRKKGVGGGVKSSGVVELYYRLQKKKREENSLSTQPLPAQREGSPPRKELSAKGKSSVVAVEKGPERGASHPVVRSGGEKGICSAP